jgi:hypothetical protein
VSGHAEHHEGVELDQLYHGSYITLRGSRKEFWFGCRQGRGVLAIDYYLVLHGFLA